MNRFFPSKAPVTVCLLDCGVLEGSAAARRIVGGINLTGDGDANDPFARTNEHGTRVAETVLAECPDARLAIVRVIDDNGWLRTVESIEQGFAWIRERLSARAPAVVCAAFGDMFHYRSDEPFENTALRRTIRALRRAGVLTVAAAGNLYAGFRHAKPQGMAWPAILRETVSVGALDDFGGVKAPSQRLHLSFGTGCATTLFATPGPPGETSGAAAVAAGRIARLRQHEPDIGADVLLARLMASTHAVRDPFTGLEWPALAPCAPPRALGMAERAGEGRPLPSSP